MADDLNAMLCSPLSLTRKDFAPPTSDAAFNSVRSSIAT
jgi:hypothetical protein